MFCGDSETGYFGREIRLGDNVLPIPLSKTHNVLVVQYSLDENFKEADFDQKIYSVGISPVVDDNHNFTIEVPTHGPIQIWGTPNRNSRPKILGQANGFNLPKDTKSHQLTAVFDFSSWVVTLGLDNLDTTTIPLPDIFKNKNFSQLDLGLSSFPMGQTPFKAWNKGTGEYGDLVQKIYIGTPGGAACLKLSKRFTEHSKSCSEFLGRFCKNCDDQSICGDIPKYLSEAEAEMKRLGADLDSDANRVVSDIEEGFKDVEKEIQQAETSVWVWLIVLALIGLLIFFLVRNKNRY